MDLTELIVQTPESWYVIDPDPKTRHDTAETDVAARSLELPAIAPFQEVVVEGLLRFGAEAEAKGALFAAVFWEPGEIGPIVADLLVLEAERSEHDPEAELASLRDALAGPEPADLGPRDISLVGIALGRSVRVRFLVDPQGGDNGQSADVRGVTQHWIPLGSGPDAALVVISVTTTALHVGDAVAGVADLVAQNLAWSTVEGGS